jgi:hypothetical protein
MGAGAIPLSVEKARAQFNTSSRSTAVYTAPHAYTGNDRVDVSFNGGNAVFTPPRALMLEYRLGRVSSEQFHAAYCTFLAESLVQHLFNWNKLFESGSIVLVCSCNGGADICHRFVLIEFLEKLGAVYCGDVSSRKKKLGKRTGRST